VQATRLDRDSRHHSRPRRHRAGPAGRERHSQGLPAVRDRCHQASAGTDREGGCRATNEGGYPCESFARVRAGHRQDRRLCRSVRPHRREDRGHRRRG
jgi:hypothetical protein